MRLSLVNFAGELRLRWWGDDAFYNYACGFEVRDTVAGAVSHEDGFGEELDKGAGLVGEPAIG